MMHVIYTDVHMNQLCLGIEFGAHVQNPSMTQP